MGALISQAGGGGASGANAGSLLFGAAGTALNAFGAYEGGVGQSQIYNYQAQVAANNATIVRANAGEELLAGQQQESVNKLQTAQTVAAQKAAQAANGLDVGVGSAPAVRASTASVGAIDAALIHYNAARASFADLSQAQSLDSQSQLDQLAAKNAKTAGALKGLDSILSGASSLSSKWNQFKLQSAPQYSPPTRDYSGPY